MWWCGKTTNQEYEAVLNDARNNYPAHLQKLIEKQKILYETELKNLKSSQNQVKEEKQVASITKLTLQLQKIEACGPTLISLRNLWKPVLNACTEKL